VSLPRVGVDRAVRLLEGARGSGGGGGGVGGGGRPKGMSPANARRRRGNGFSWGRGEEYGGWAWTSGARAVGGGAAGPSDWTAGQLGGGANNGGCGATT